MFQQPSSGAARGRVPRRALSLANDRSSTLEEQDQPNYHADDTRLVVIFCDAWPDRSMVWVARRLPTRVGAALLVEHPSFRIGRLDHQLAALRADGVARPFEG